MTIFACHLTDTLTMYELTLPDLRRHLRVTEKGSARDETLFTQGSLGDKQLFGYPCRFNGYMAILCLKGHFRVEINLSSFLMEESSLLVYIPGNIIRVSPAEGHDSRHVRYALVACSREFISSMEHDLSLLYEKSMLVFNNPCVKLLPQEIRSCRLYYLLAKSLARQGLGDTSSRMRPLFMSSFQYFAALWAQHLEAGKQLTRADLPRQTAKSRRLFADFLQLVSAYHNTEHQIDFYADRLMLTPKYLSRQIKEISGRTVPEWIDAFLLLEAKNMLKYSDNSVKEIVYALHFSNTAVFYQFFKKYTGMTPLAYKSGQ